MPNQKKLPKLLCIVGPTSSGKTSLSLQLAKKNNGEIISADSRQIYKNMNIGTNKFSGYKTSEKKYEVAEMAYPINAIEYQKITHYLIDVLKPDEDFSLFQFKETTVSLIKEINNRGKLAIMAGGTGLYINSVVDNLEIPEIPADVKLRSELDKKTTEELYKMFKDLDQTGSKTIDRNNKRRLIRAIEISKNSPNPYSVLRTKGPKIFDILMLGLELPRELLYERINNWVESIFGFSPLNSPIIKETQGLLKKNNPKESLPLQGLVYKQVIWYLAKAPSQKNKGEKISFEEAKELSKQSVRNYAKRQMTWFRKDEKIKWVKPDDLQKISDVINNFL
jgi:tRNA dimethylallyltransferase